MYWLVPKSELKRAFPADEYLVELLGLTSELEEAEADGSGIELVVGYELLSVK